MLFRQYAVCIRAPSSGGTLVATPNNNQSIASTIVVANFHP
jgi:hypothetical protein